MNYKFHFLPIIFSAVIVHLFVSCSDSEIQSSDVPEITQSIFVVPENYIGDPYNRYAPSDEFYVDINEKIRFCGIYSVNGEFVPSDQSIMYYNTHKWTVDDNEASTSSLYYKFDKAGVHRVSFETVDHLGDTLLSKATVYVNTPTTISLLSPPNRYNLVNGDNPDGLELSWKVSGIDPWESSVCIIYATYYKDEIWESPLGETDCSQSVELLGKLNKDINENGTKVNSNIDNSTIYWGIRALTKNSRGNIEQEYSEVFSFSTKLENNGKAIIEVPVACMYSQYPEKSKLNGAFISKSGDTLSKFSNINANSTIKKTLPPQSNIKIVVCDSIRTEYGCSSMTIDLAPGTKTLTDTLFLQDKVKPNMVPAATEAQSSSQIKFFILDNGSGVNASKITVIMNADTLRTYFDDYTLSIPNTCKRECNLFIKAEDYARNKAPEVYWKVSTEKSVTTIKGPFAESEGDK
jgi:hypothetical protein